MLSTLCTRARVSVQPDLQGATRAGPVFVGYGRYAWCRHLVHGLPPAWRARRRGQHRQPQDVQEVREVLAVGQTRHRRAG